MQHSRKGVRERDNRRGTAAVFRHLIAGGVFVQKKLFEVAGVRAPEGIDVLIVVTYGNDSQRIIRVNKALHKLKVLTAHVLRFVNYKRGFGGTGRIGAPGLDESGRAAYDVPRFLQRPRASEEDKGVGMKRLDVYVRGLFADKLNQALFKFCRLRPAKT